MTGFTTAFAMVLALCGPIEEVNNWTAEAGIVSGPGSLAPDGNGLVAVHDPATGQDGVAVLDFVEGHACLYMIDKDIPTDTPAS